MAVRLPAPLTPLWPRLKAVYIRSTWVVSPFTRRLSRVRGGFLPRFQKEILELTAFLRRDGIVDANAHPHVRAERLLVPGLPDQHKGIPPWTVDFVRGRLRPSGVEIVPGRRLYVTRGNRPHNRIVTNEPEVVELLSRRGFEVVDPGASPVIEQIRMFADAECIVSPHGAALTNLLFASPGSSVVEILAPSYVDVSYWKLADCVPGLNYRYLLGMGKQPRPGREEVAVMNDITVHLAALERALDSLPVKFEPAGAEVNP